MADELRWQTFAGEGNSSAQLGDSFINRSDAKIHVRVLNMSMASEHATLAGFQHLQLVKGNAFDGGNNSIQAKITMVGGHGDGGGGNAQKMVALARGQLTLEPNEQVQGQFATISGSIDAGAQMIEMGWEN